MSPTGLVTRVGRGQATITAKTSSGNGDTCVVTVASLYFPGSVWDPGGPYPCYWKDGELVRLGTDEGYVADILAVSGDTVSVAEIAAATTRLPTGTTARGRS